MGMDLKNQQGKTIRMPLVHWAKMLELAEMGGWEPVGTEKPPNWDDDPDWVLPETWDGGYRRNEGQLVTSGDAEALAQALERMLDKIPDHPVPSTMWTYRPGDETSSPFLTWMLANAPADGMEVLAHDDSIEPLEYFGGEQKIRVESFIDFCRQGGFCIF